MWMYIAEHYLDDFDYFLAGGDDMFYIIENLMSYLDSAEIRQLTTNSEYGVYLGRRFTPPKQKIETKIYYLTPLWKILVPPF